MAISDELAVLRWIVGGADSAPADVPVDEDRLARRIFDHKLTPRFISKIVEKNPTKLSTSFVANQVITLHRLRIHFEHQMDVCRKVSLQLVAEGLPPITIFKGVSTYALTCDERHIPISGDVDFFHEKGEHAIALFANLGYVSDWQHIGQPEIARLTDQTNGMMIEPHRFFRLWNYPSNMPTVLSAVPSYPSRAIISGVARRRLRLSDIARYRVPGRVLGTGDLLVPNATVTVAILCMHAFIDAISVDGWTMCLSEIANIHDLLELSEFSSPLFCQLVEEFHLKDAISLVACALRYWFGEVPESLSGLPAQWMDKSAFPVCLALEGGWAVPFSIEDFFLPIYERGFVSNLGAETICAGPYRSELPVRYSNDPLAADTTVLRSIESSPSREDAPPRIQFTVSWDMECVVFNIYTASQPQTDCGEYFVAFCIDSRVSHSMWDPYHEQREIVRLASTPDVVCDPFVNLPGHHFQVCIPHHGDDRVQCLLEFVGRVGWRKIRPVVVFPLEVIRYGQADPHQDAREDWQASGLGDWQGYLIES